MEIIEAILQRLKDGFGISGRASLGIIVEDEMVRIVTQQVMSEIFMDLAEEEDSEEE